LCIFLVFGRDLVGSTGLVTVELFVSAGPRDFIILQFPDHGLCVVYAGPCASRRRMQRHLPVYSVIEMLRGAIFEC
jgi:hypothetical protein